MPASLALSASAPVANDFIGAPAAGLFFGAQQGVDGALLEAEPAAGAAALGGMMRSLSAADATSILEALSTQAAALSLVLAADAGGTIRLPDSLRGIIEAATVLPPFLGGAAN